MTYICYIDFSVISLPTVYGQLSALNEHGLLIGQTAFNGTVIEHIVQASLVCNIFISRLFVYSATLLWNSDDDVGVLHLCGTDS